ncbi:rCG58100 [Rattus norvegicus]|uniref:RCG58100 n=1 Tax=Rattus norvegicus TaxID=10116 RepID=A6J4A5_RAT|nr:rCG58100 [Rattus norvegicus]
MGDKRKTIQLLHRTGWSLAPQPFPLSLCPDPCPIINA